MIAIHLYYKIVIYDLNNSLHREEKKKEADAFTFELKDNNKCLGRRRNKMLFLLSLYKIETA